MEFERGETSEQSIKDNGNIDTDMKSLCTSLNKCSAISQYLGKLSKVFAMGKMHSFEVKTIDAVHWFAIGA